MSGKRRIVTIPVDDERVTRLWVEHYGDLSDDRSAWPDRIAEEAVPVPPDDQLTRDIALVLEAAHDVGEPDYERAGRISEADTRLRATFHLDERPSLDDVLSHGRARFGLDEGNES